MMAIVVASVFWFETAPTPADEPTKLTVVRAAVNCFAYSRDGRSIFVGDALGGLASFDVSTGRRTELRQVSGQRGLVASIDSLAASPDGKSIAFGWSSSVDEGLSRGALKTSAITLWDIEGRRVRYELDTEKKIVRSLDFSPDGRVLACAMHGVTSLREASTGRETGQLVDTAPPGRSIFVRDVRYSADGRYLGVREPYFREEHEPSITGGQIVVRDAADRRIISRVPIEGSGLKGFAFAPDGKSMACGWDDVDENKAGILHLSTTDGRLLKRFDGPKFSIRSIAFSPDGRLLVGGGGDGILWAWSLPDGKQIAGPEPLLRGIDAITFSPDGRFLAAAASNMQIPLRPNDIDFKLWIYAVKEFRRSKPGEKDH